MAKVILVCGKICSGKTYYCGLLQRERRAVWLSCDEILSGFFQNALGDGHDEMLARIQNYLRNKAAEIVFAGADVILDWGFWSRRERAAISDYFAKRGVAFEWHYVDVSDQRWRRNIAARNAAAAAGATTDYPVDGGLLAKLSREFEIPDRSEIAVWHTVPED